MSRTRPKPAPPQPTTEVLDLPGLDRNRMFTREGLEEAVRDAGLHSLIGEK